jgi:hypothetical protein
LVGRSVRTGWGLTQARPGPGKARNSNREINEPREQKQQKKFEPQRHKGTKIATIELNRQVTQANDFSAQFIWFSPLDLLIWIHRLFLPLFFAISVPLWLRGSLGI